MGHTRKHTPSELRDMYRALVRAGNRALTDYNALVLPKIMDDIRVFEETHADLFTEDAAPLKPAHSVMLDEWLFRSLLKKRNDSAHPMVTALADYEAKMKQGEQ